MNNLVLGSSGFVGQYLCNYLKAKGETVIEYDIARDPSEDCRTSELPLDNIDRVYFLAWMVGGSNYLYDPATQKEQLDWNAQLLANCMNQLRNVPFVFISSQLAENCDTVYGTLKRLGEHWAKLNGGVAVRLWNVYGAYEDSTVKSHVVADFIHQALNTNKIVMQTDGEERRQFIYIEDVCNALHESFNHKGTFDITTMKWDSIYGMASLISTHTGCELAVGHKKGTTLVVPHKPLIPHWTANTNLSTGLKKTIQLFRDKK